MNDDAVRHLVGLARSWIGTPYCHQASVRGVGCDCLGLVRGLWRDLHGDEPESLPRYGPDWSEIEREERLWVAMRRHLRERPLSTPLNAGQVVLFRMRQGSVAKHLGLVSQSARPNDAARFIHAYERHGVIESPLSAPWARRIVARFEMV